jgi:quinol monooxygenase YgiN
MSEPLLSVIAVLIARPGNEDEVRRHLIGFVEPTRKEEGCVQYDLHESNDEPGKFYFYENWTSDELLQKHLASPHISAFREISGDLLAQAPHVVKLTRIA